MVNRDSQGNLKFAHRSIMEYLFVARFRKFPLSTPQLAWTDQMKRFYWETSFAAWEKSKAPISFQKEADLSDLEHLRLKPVIVLRSVPAVMMEQDRQNFRSISREKGLRIERAPHFYRIVDVPKLNEEAVDAVPHFYKYLASNILISRLPDSPVLNEAASRLISMLGSGEPRVVVDHALGLAWEVPGDNQGTHPELAGPRSQLLSYLRFAGFADWRLPTVEEAFSLVHLSRCEEYRSWFADFGTCIWTADMVGIQRISLNIQTQELRAEGFSHPSGQWPRAVCVASPKFG